ncbi:MAG: outer membrane lipoprotein carrier protein LolA [Chthoniobacterales bacterium]
MRIALTALLTLATTGLHAEPDWAALESWIERQQTVRNLEADFTQTRRLPTLRVPSRQPGKIWFQSDGRFRFQLGDPPETIAIRDGGTTVTLIDKRQGTTRTIDESATGPDSRQLLLMRFPITGSIEEFRELFDVTRMEEKGKTTELDLVPRAADFRKNVKRINLEYQTASGILSNFNVELTNGGGLETNFTHVKVNQPNLPKSVFETP